MIVAGVDLIRAGLAVPQRLTAATFMALSMLTVPHMFVPVLLQHHKARAVGSR